MWNLQALNNVGQLALLIVTAVGGYIAVEAHYAKASQLRAVELRIDQKILLDRQDRVQERIWKFQDRGRSQQLTPLEQQEVQKLEKDYKDLDKALDNINTNMEKLK